MVHRRDTIISHLEEKKDDYQSLFWQLFYFTQRNDPEMLDAFIKMVKWE